MEPCYGHLADAVIREQCTACNRRHPGVAVIL